VSRVEERVAEEVEECCAWIVESLVGKGIGWSITAQSMGVER
jgi:hypothetical protein